MSIPQYVYHLSTEVDVIITEECELILWSNRDQRPLVALTPQAAEKVILEMIDNWHTYKELCEQRGRAYRSQVDSDLKKTSQRMPKAVSKFKMGGRTRQVLS